MNLTERTDYAGMYLADSMDSALIIVHFISAPTWRFTSCLDDHHCTGIDVPILRGAVFEVGICPEVIAGTTADLEDDVFLDYLTSLGVHAHLHVTHSALPEDLAELAVLSDQRCLSTSSFATFESVRASA